ncbi:6-phosphofructokinase 2 [Caulobacter ginsengisoli]|uniref:Phosphofructokinase n=1 Tax=Caulobacter ginsengisoli TaxID=400775 RepID=A0ABU0IQT3_9CAUL|nr:1-phosphofructokinase family hexose kinase [Caulobacter ginsengisoli]MDQ0464375.1 6-phosphofructokinase 2 [Caulobacter ginsengisoli]
MSQPVNIVTLTPNPALDLSTAVDRVEPVRKLRCEAARFDPGGGGVNVARVVHRLGGAVQAIYPAGGPAGARLTTLLAREGLASGAVPIAGETRESFTVTDRGDGAEYRFVLPGPSLSPAEWRACLNAVLARAPAGGLVVVSGSLPPGVPPSALADLARRVRESGLRLAADSSGPALAAVLEAGVWLVKPSLRELCELTGLPLPDLATRLAACRALIAAGSAEIVALSLGDEGALLVTANEAFSARALAVRPVSTVGAGDSFLGGLLWGITRDLPMADCLRQAMAAGAAALLSPGTGLCRPEDVQRLAGEVEVERLPA